MSAVDVVQRQLDTYNVQDLEAFLATYAPDCVICLSPSLKVMVAGSTI